MHTTSNIAVKDAPFAIEIPHTYPSFEPKLSIVILESSRWCSHKTNHPIVFSAKLTLRYPLRPKTK